MFKRHPDHWPPSPPTASCMHDLRHRHTIYLSHGCQLRHSTVFLSKPLANPGTRKERRRRRFGRAKTYVDATELNQRTEPTQHNPRFKTKPPSRPQAWVSCRFHTKKNGTKLSERAGRMNFGTVLFFIFFLLRLTECADMRRWRSIMHCKNEEEWRRGGGKAFGTVAMCERETWPSFLDATRWRMAQARRRDGFGITYRG